MTSRKISRADLCNAFDGYHEGWSLQIYEMLMDGCFTGQESADRDSRNNERVCRLFDEAGRGGIDCLKELLDKNPESTLTQERVALILGGLGKNPSYDYRSEALRLLDRLESEAVASGVSERVQYSKAIIRRVQS